LRSAVEEPFHHAPDQPGIFLDQLCSCLFIPLVRFLDQSGCAVHNLRPLPIVFSIFTTVPSPGVETTSNRSMKASINENPIPERSRSGLVVNKGSMACCTSSIPRP